MKFLIISIFLKLLISFSDKNLMLEGLIKSDLLILLPSESLIPLQFINESEISLYVGIVVIVLSKF